ncbi:20161_t:CDS:2 [Gigaspora margarita]|uniref:20161_t:CDS:1 n=1 Tax=Gigaspora margarita TaxID=4874 RepID=A0ABN7VGN1_GIGMA|nr:20161_t:CDS:2 [Gigaspora margarita]
MSTREFYYGYTSILSYIKNRKENSSFQEFVELYYEMIVEASPHTDNWCGLETAWEMRFLRAVKEGALVQWSVVQGFAVVGCPEWWWLRSLVSGRLTLDLKILGAIAKHTTKTIVSDVLKFGSSGKRPSGGIGLVNTKKMKVETDESEGTGNCLKANGIESIDTRPDPKEIRDLTQEEMEIRNKLLTVLNSCQDKAKNSGATYMNSVCLNGILDLSDEEIYENEKKPLI